MIHSNHYQDCNCSTPEPLGAGPLTRSPTPGVAARSQLKRIGIAGIVLALSACGGVTPDIATPTDSIASFRQGDQFQIAECSTVPSLPEGMIISVDEATNSCMISGAPEDASVEAQMYRIVAGGVSADDGSLNAGEAEVRISVTFEDGAVIDGQGFFQVDIQPSPASLSGMEFRISSTPTRASRPSNLVVQPSRNLELILNAPAPQAELVVGQALNPPIIFTVTGSVATNESTEEYDNEEDNEEYDNEEYDNEEDNEEYDSGEYDSGEYDSGEDNESFTVTGSAATNERPTCNVVPELPLGLFLGTPVGQAGCQIAGTPVGVQGAQTYLVTVTYRTGEQGSNTIRLSVRAAAVAPALTDLPIQSLVIGQEISQTFTNSGGAPDATSCTVSPGLPEGLSVELSSDGSSCTVAGSLQPSASFGSSARLDYSVRAENSAGFSVGVLTIKLLGQEPPNLVDIYGLCELEVGQHYEINFANISGGSFWNPLRDGGRPQTCTVSAPDLPDGLSIAVSDDGQTCTISGIPAISSLRTTYTATATNAAGSNSATVDIVVYGPTVTAPIVVAPALTDLPIQSLIIGQEISLTFTNSGGAPDATSCTASPGLPEGLSVELSSDGSSCTVAGSLQPSASFGSSARLDYSVRAENSAGFSVGVLTIKLLGQEPPNLVDIYGLCELEVGQHYEINFANISGGSFWNPLRDGGRPQTCTVSAPDLPDGLSIAVSDDGQTCTISGIPAISSLRTTYTATATNAAGSNSATVDIVVHGPTVTAPIVVAPALTDLPIQSLIIGQEISLTFTNSGGAPDATSCTASSELPEGLSVELSSDGSSCTVVGSLQSSASFESSAQRNYRIIAENSAGFSVGVLTIKLLGQEPPDLISIYGLCELEVGQHYEINFANISGGSFRNPRRAGGHPQTCAVSAPDLPDGLSIAVSDDGRTCTISGIPAISSPRTTYTATATNAAGSDSATVDIVVYGPTPIVVAPVLTDLPVQSLVIGQEISQTFTNAGGAPDANGCTVRSGLPEGLSVGLSADGSSCTVSGSLQSLRGVRPGDQRDYSVRADNSAGFSVGVLTIKFLEPPNLISIYGLCELEVGQHYEINFANINSGGFWNPWTDGGRPQTCTVSAPDLPDGLSIAVSDDGQTCTISGIPAISSPRTTYTATATNAAGSDSATVDIVVYEPTPIVVAPVLTDLPVQSLIIGQEISLTFTNAGGAPDPAGCTVSSGLPRGLSVGLSADGSSCTVSGSLQSSYFFRLRAQRDFSVRAENSAGFSESVLTIKFLKPPNLLNIYGLCELEVGQHYEINFLNINGGAWWNSWTDSGRPQTCTVSAPDLPDGLSIAVSDDGRTCTISGIPTISSPRATYTATATNAAGSSSATAEIVVYDPAPIVVAPALTDLPAQSLIIGQEISQTFTNTGGAPDPAGCTVSPGLPDGLSVGLSSDGSSCAISGTPTVSTSAIVYAVTATNTGGYSDASVIIGVGKDQTALSPVLVRQVSAGFEHVCAVTINGRLYCWGKGNANQLGLGDSRDRILPARVGDSSDWSSVSSGSSLSCGIKSSGAMHCWGRISNGVGLTTLYSSSAPQKVGTDTDWAQVSVSALNHACAIKNNGQLYCWGYGNFGKLGIGNTNEQSRPVLVGLATDSWASVSAGGQHTCAINSDARLYCWGRGNFGQLGHGGASPGVSSTAHDRDTPTLIGELSWSMASSSGSSTCGVSSAGGLYCWGYSESGHLGNGVDGRSHLASPGKVGQANDWVSVSVGYERVCAINTNSQMYCWGRGQEGALGLGDTTNRVYPTQVGTAIDWAQISSESDHACAVDSGGELYCWGRGYEGALGLGDIENRLIPTRVLIDTATTGDPEEEIEPGDESEEMDEMDLTEEDEDDDSAPVSPPDNSLTQITAGPNYNCGIDSNGKLACWGRGVVARFSGFGSTLVSASISVNLAEDMNWVSVDAGGAMLCAINDQGLLYCWEIHPCPFLLWGFTSATLLGGGPFHGFYAVPGEGWQDISVGDEHACAINTAGELHCWGDGTDGRLGTVNMMSGRVGANYTWRKVSAGNHHTCAIDSEDELYCWGRGALGRLGLNDDLNRTTPMRVGSDSDWSTLSSGFRHTCATKINNSLYCWGSNYGSELGLGSGQADSVAVPTRVGLLSDWLSVSSGNQSTCALQTSGSLYCWGDDLNSLYSSASNLNTDVPVQMGNSGDWSSVVAGGKSVCSLNTRGVVYCAQPYVFTILSVSSLDASDSFNNFPTPIVPLQGAN